MWNSSDLMQDVNRVYLERVDNWYIHCVHKKTPTHIFFQPGDWLRRLDQCFAPVKELVGDIVTKMTCRFTALSWMLNTITVAFCIHLFPFVSGAFQPIVVNNIHRQTQNQPGPFSQSLNTQLNRYRVILCTNKCPCMHVWWCTEDGHLVRICLVKVDKTAGSCWHSLLADQFAADPFVADQMQQKLTLQRFQLEVSHFCCVIMSLCCLVGF